MRATPMTASTITSQILRKINHEYQDHADDRASPVHPDGVQRFPLKTLCGHLRIVALSARRDGVN